MDFELSEEQRAFRELARDFAAREMAPHAAEWDEKSMFPVETLRQAAALGFAAIYVRGDVGGAGLSRLDAALVFEELGAGLRSKKHCGKGTWFQYVLCPQTRAPG